MGGGRRLLLARFPCIPASAQGILMGREELAMDSLLRLNLQNADKPSETANLPITQEEKPRPPVVGKRLNRIANRAAHKAAKSFARSTSSLFSK